MRQDCAAVAVTRAANCALTQRRSSRANAVAHATPSAIVRSKKLLVIHQRAKIIGTPNDTRGSLRPIHIAVSLDVKKAADECMQAIAAQYVTTTLLL